MSGEGVAPLLAGAQKLAKIVDGIIVPSSLSIEPVGVPYCREFYKKRGQELFTVGLQVHELCWTDVPPTNTTGAAFLDNALAQYGPKSVLYVSFGSRLFPIAAPIGVLRGNAVKMAAALRAARAGEVGGELQRLAAF
ncbi:hypothetical protein C8R44DRAFT_891732 [Mycena epipterygia]|nr:hypothetical protein C8R44DRAFT_891732 [Mycena epipterygia]